MTRQKTTADPVKVYNVIAEIMSRRENLKITASVKERDNYSKKQTA